MILFYFIENCLSPEVCGTWTELNGKAPNVTGVEFYKEQLFSQTII